MTWDDDPVHIYDVAAKSLLHVPCGSGFTNALLSRLHGADRHRAKSLRARQPRELAMLSPNIMAFVEELHLPSIGAHMPLPGRVIDDVPLSVRAEILPPRPGHRCGRTSD